ncbi:hypothetical protein [Cryobacterium psychrophilum]|uniref:Uncharacterized protein n=1 Tax=Cryobacterium psychrophilum TaxID=41988 RepID=A0A4Y8KUT4_9MICO|nr:hypothetical protein [Cryobacterium psychrophilum]TDW29750.1 hypothetical protein EDD25_1460 [Cryobacterium psychrophilum]TFD81852.1 hypothetical protein E3T53_02370 [Cryobacterium psychrophilum]
MTVNRGTRPDSIAFVSPLVTLIALVALLFGVFAIHSEATGQDMHMAGSSPSVAASAAVDASAAAAVSLVAPVVAALSTGSHGGMLDCALLAMACVLLLVLIALVVLTRLPATYRLLLESGGRPASIVTVPVPRPSLTALSIRRV